jgi:hypothetical protein
MACGCSGKKGALARAGAQTGIQSSGATTAPTRMRRTVRRTIFAVVPPPENHEAEEELFVVLHSAVERSKRLGNGWTVQRREA